MKSTIPDGRRLVGQPGLFGTKTNSTQAEAGARAELGKNHATKRIICHNFVLL